MGKFPNPNPNFTPNFNKSNPNFNNSFSRKKIKNGNVDELKSDDTPSFSRRVSFDISGYSKAEMRRLRFQLMSELDKVRNLSTRVENGSAGLKKRPSPFPTSNGVDNGPNPKRFAPSSIPKASQQVMKLCGTVLKKLSNQKAGIWFNSPVDAVGMGLHDYFTVIDKPMDLGTIKERLDKGFYATPEEFGFDVRLTFNNAIRYNSKDHEVHTYAGQYLALFERWFKPILAKFESEKQVHLQDNSRKMANRVEEDVMIVNKVNTWSKFPSPEPVKTVKHATIPEPKPPTPPAAAAPPPPARPPITAPIPIPEAVPVVETSMLEFERSVVGEVRRGRKPEGKLPKPKAKDPNKREMSMDEKRKLGNELQNLPEEKMSNVLHIIRKRNGDLNQEGDEIELDFEVLDNETLWELDRFVTNFNKMVSKIKRQALIGGSQTNNGDHSDDTNEAGVSDMMVEKPSKVKKAGDGGGVVEVGEENVDIGDEMQVNSFPPLEIDKDDEKQHSGTSGSSSSGSDDSSSSDSDSRSSSDSDSDVDDAQSHDNESKNFPQ